MNATTTATATQSKFSLHLFKGLEKSGNGWKARCPAHDDTVPSLSITKDGGNWLLCCHAKCATDEILRTVGLAWSDLFDGAGPRIQAVYNYTDEAGKLLYQTIRYEPKNFKARKPEGQDWSWKLGDVRRVLYRLPEVLAANDVLMVEGEKDCDSAREWKFAATCNPFGAGKWREEYAESLRRRNVTIIADADVPGREHAQDVAKSLAGKAASVKVIEMPNAKDLSEWKVKGGTRDELLKIIHDAPEWREQPLPWRQAFKSISQMEQGEIGFLIAGILPEGVIFIGALAGVGKTWFALSMAKALTTGRPFLDNYAVPEPVNVIYLIPEAGEKAFRKRLERMKIPEERFLCRTMKDGLMKLDNPLLLAAVRELKPVMFLDSAIRFNGADNENDASQNAGGLANDIFELVKAGARAVVGLHHSPKSSAGQEMSLENVLRGTGDLGAMCDAAYGLKCLKQETLELRVQCVKPRDFEPVPPFHIQGRPYINDRGDFVVLTPGASSVGDTRSEVEALDKAIREKPTASYRDLAAKTGINISRIAEVAAKAGWRKDGEVWKWAAQTSFVN